MTLPTKLVAEIRAAHEAAERAAGSYEQHATTCGKLLIRAKRQLPHGTFTPWLEDNFAGKPRTARLYMQLARDEEAAVRGEAKRQRAAVLSQRQRLAELRAYRRPQKRSPPEPVIVRGAINKKLGDDVFVTMLPIKQTCPPDCALKDNGCNSQVHHFGRQNRELEHIADERGLNHLELVGMEANSIRVVAAELAKPWRPLLRELRQFKRDLTRLRVEDHRLKRSLNLLVSQVRRLAEALRLHTGGDCKTDEAALILSDACREWLGHVWTYTHAWRVVARRSWGDVSVLASCETSEDALRAIERGYAPELTVPEHPANGKAWSDENGITWIPCPAQTNDTNCVRCGLCFDDRALLGRRAGIAFEAHGRAKRQVQQVVQLRLHKGDHPEAAE